MKTTKADRQVWRQNFGEDARNGNYGCMTIIKLLDDMNSLESRLAWAEGMLERAKRLVGKMTVNEQPKLWLSDLERGPEGEK